MEFDLEYLFEGWSLQITDWCTAVADYLPMIILADIDLGIDLKFGNFK
jgi:hypothetical protein